jgi:hypothetical protein
MELSVKKVNYAKHHGICEKCLYPSTSLVKCIHCRSVVPILFKNQLSVENDLSKPEFKACFYCLTISTNSTKLQECDHIICVSCLKEGLCPICSNKSEYTTINQNKIEVELKQSDIKIIIPNEKVLSRSAKVSPIKDLIEKSDDLEGMMTDRPNVSIHDTNNIKPKSPKKKLKNDDTILIESNPKLNISFDQDFELIGINPNPKLSCLRKFLDKCQFLCKKKKSLQYSETEGINNINL